MQKQILHRTLTMLGSFLDFEMLSKVVGQQLSTFGQMWTKNVGLPGWTGWDHCLRNCLPRRPWNFGPCCRDCCPDFGQTLPPFALCSRCLTLCHSWFCFVVQLQEDSEMSQTITAKLHVRPGPLVHFTPSTAKISLGRAILVLLVLALHKLLLNYYEL